MVIPKHQSSSSSSSSSSSTRNKKIAVLVIGLPLLLSISLLFIFWTTFHLLSSEIPDPQDLPLHNNNHNKNNSNSQLLRLARRKRTRSTAPPSPVARYKTDDRAKQQHQQQSQKEQNPMEEMEQLENANVELRKEQHQQQSQKEQNLMEAFEQLENANVELRKEKNHMSRSMELMEESLTLKNELLQSAKDELEESKEELYKAKQELKLGTGWDLSKSVVIGMASPGYGMEIYQQFVGSLRATGYIGHIILGVTKDTMIEKTTPIEITNAETTTNTTNPQQQQLNFTNVARYLNSQNVTTKIIDMDDGVCTYNGTVGYEGNVIRRWRCFKAYPDYKMAWARFLFYQDWLKDCDECKDGVILTDVGTGEYFQRDPFVTAARARQQLPLVLFEEHPDLDNTHWLTHIPVLSCREYTLGNTPVLHAGSVMGSREGILNYIDVMVEEFDYWKKREKCRMDMPLDEQSIHNYLYYANRLKNAMTVPHRRGPIHVVGKHAARIFEDVKNEAQDKGIGIDEVFKPKKGIGWQNWLPKEHDLLDPRTGLIVNLDGSPSAQVQQVDKFGPLNRRWLKKMMKHNWPYNKPQELGAVPFVDDESPDPLAAHSCLKKKVIPRNFNMSLASNVVSNQGRIYKVNLWDDGTYCKIRETMLNIEGFSLHPRTNLVDSPEEADIIVWASTRGMTEREIPPSNYSNVVLLDYADGCSRHSALDKVKHLVGHFKRSFVHRRFGKFSNNCTDGWENRVKKESVLPFAYSGAQTFASAGMFPKRKYAITNMLRDDSAGSNKQRKIILNYTKSFVEKHNLTNHSFIGNTLSGKERGFEKVYFKVLANSKIIVTMNPADWEGDFRLWEALLSGALVFVDQMAILDWIPHPFKHKEHLIFYDPANRTEFENLLEYYVSNEAEAESIGLRGYEHTAHHHMTTDRVSYILDNIEDKLEL